MSINFHDPSNQQSYKTREADNSWKETVHKILDTKRIHRAADLGCGGGIYTKALADMGIDEITGVDFSEVMIKAAELNCRKYSQIDFRVGNALATSLPNQAFDLVLMRALTHHLDELFSSFQESNRILTPGGTLLIQDRTPSDCLLEGTANHIRGYFFSKFPQLKQVEVQRRHSSKIIKQELGAAGFKDIEEIKLWETRRSYPSKAELLTDIHSRNGRSILHELTDGELDQLIDYIDSNLTATDQIIEKDRWTIWKAIKK